MIRRMNAWLAERMANMLSSMWLFWGLTILIWATVILQRPSGPQGWILFLVSVFFQGVSLPVLAFVSNIQGDRTEKLLRETHDAVMSELTELRRMHEEQATELAELRAVHRELGRRSHDR